MRFHYLAEHVVTNVDYVTKFAEKWASKVKAPEAKAWMAKRLRAFILNNETLLTRMPPADITQDMPGYVLQAVDRGEPIFVFDQAAHPDFADRIMHLADFFEILHDTATGAVNQDNSVAVQNQQNAKKILSKIQKMTLEQVELAHTQWSAAQTKLVSNMSKDGCEVVLTFADGRYWVRYTTADTMKRDGKDLQNCLGDGNYWKQVSAGTQDVYGLRKASDEAVVGMRILLKPENNYSDKGQYPQVAECKGKQNGPALPEDVPYILAMLEKLGVSNASQDLKNAGVHVNSSSGRYGTFEEIADVVLDTGAIKIMKTDEDYGSGSQSGERSSRYLIKVRRHQFWATVQNNEIIRLEAFKTVPAKLLIAGLNAANMSVGKTALSALSEIGIFPSDAGFGTIDEIGVTVWHGPSDGDRAVSTMKDGTGYLFVYLDDVATRLTVIKRVISEIPHNMDPGFFGEGLAALDAAGVRLHRDLDIKHLWPVGVVSTKQGYRRVRDVSKAVHSLPDHYELLAVRVPVTTRAKLYFMVDHDNSMRTPRYITFAINEGDTAKIYGDLKSQSTSKAACGMLQYLAEKHSFPTGWSFDTVLINNPGLYLDRRDWAYRSSQKRFMEIIADPETNAKYDGLCEIGQNNYLKAFLKTAFYPDGRDESGVLKSAVQAKIFRTLKPSKDELIKVISDNEMKLHGHVYHNIAITPADMLGTLPEVLPDFADKIEHIMDAIYKMLELIIRQNGTDAVYTLKVFDSNLNWKLYRLVNAANDRAKADMRRRGDEALKADTDPDQLADDHFGALNVIRKAR